MRFTALIIIAAITSGCVSYNTDLINSAGHATKCAGWGFGVIGVPVAAADHHSCMQKAEADGYHEAGEPQPQQPTAAAHQ